MLHDANCQHIEPVMVDKFAYRIWIKIFFKFIFLVLERVSSQRHSLELEFVHISEKIRITTKYS